VVPNSSATLFLFPQIPDTGFGAQKAFFKGTSCSPGIKRQGRKADNSTQSSPALKNTRSDTSNPTRLHGVALNQEEERHLYQYRKTHTPAKCVRTEYELQVEVSSMDVMVFFSRLVDILY
jgi:hypothetical protein